MRTTIFIFPAICAMLFSLTGCDESRGQTGSIIVGKIVEARALSKPNGWDTFYQLTFADKTVVTLTALPNTVIPLNKEVTIESNQEGIIKSIEIRKDTDFDSLSKRIFPRYEDNQNHYER